MEIYVSDTDVIIEVNKAYGTQVSAYAISYYSYTMPGMMYWPERSIHHASHIISWYN